MKGRETIYFIGCDMGGWHSSSRKCGDAVASCAWKNGRQAKSSIPDNPTANVSFFPIEEKGVLVQMIEEAVDQEAKIIVAIDAALGWPEKFRQAVAGASKARHGFDGFVPKPGSAINNPYLYRFTEKEVKKIPSVKPLSAPGDRFGNNSTKAQALVRQLVDELPPPVYRPPFEGWSPETARKARSTIIEVYPSASRACEAFNSIRWDGWARLRNKEKSDDCLDAQRCALTAACYANTIGLIEEDLPEIELPPPHCSGPDRRRIQSEGWIFFPSRKDQGT